MLLGFLTRNKLSFVSQNLQLIIIRVDNIIINIYHINKKKIVSFIRVLGNC